MDLLFDPNVDAHLLDCVVLNMREVAYLTGLTMGVLKSWVRSDHTSSADEIFFSKQKGRWSCSLREVRRYLENIPPKKQPLKE
jgi:hypothetical protein